MPKLRVGVLRGGPGHEYEVSLRTGQNVLRYLPEDDYLARDILIDRQGRWHLNGLPTMPERLPGHIDVVFNALHGEYGEDGRVQQLLNALSLPYTGSGHLASAVGMNKHLTKDFLRQAGIRTPYGLLIEPTETAVVAAERVLRRLGPPWIVKPLDRGSSVGVGHAATVAALPVAITEARRYAPSVLIEQFIRGREATCGVIDDFRGLPCYSLPPVEIRRPAEAPVWDYENKYNGQTAELCPGNFSAEEKREIERLSRLAHQTLNLRHYSRSDFIVTPRGVYLLEVNTLPGLTSESLLPKSLQAVGCSYPEFLRHIVNLALK